MRRMNLFAAVAAIAAFAFGAIATDAQAAGVTLDLSARVAGTYTGANGLGSVNMGLNLTALTQLTGGTTSGHADLMFSDRRTLAASTSENLDLAGVLTDPFGAVLTFGHAKAIYVAAAAANTNDVCFGGAASNAFAGPFADVTDKVCVKPGGVALIFVASGVGWTVTPATGDLLKVANNGAGTPVTYDIVIVGTST